MNSLKAKKVRELEQAYVIEGEKITIELLKSDLAPKRILCTEAWYYIHSHLVKKFLSVLTILKDYELEKISQHKSTPSVIVVVPIEKQPMSIQHNKLMLLLDGIQDPGNMGTIIRSADWFGINRIFISEHCVDIYNPKVIQSSMGSIFRVSVFETDLSELMRENKAIPVFAADMHGSSIYDIPICTPCFLLIGSEGKGVSDSYKPLVNKFLSIPGHGKAESLNAAVAASILMSHWAATLK